MYTAQLNSYVQHINFFFAYYIRAETMIRKLLIVCLFVAVCLELNQGKPSSQAKMMEEYADALVQGELFMLHNLGA